MLTVEQKIESLNDLMKGLKEEFKEFITDKSIELNRRWNCWVAAPKELKKEYSYIQHFKSIDEDAIMYDGWLMHVEKYQIVFSTDIIECIEENKILAEDLPDLMEEDDERLAKIDINTVKEEILSLNMYSFNYDW